jgi:molecular chaperone GrpE
VRNSDRFGLEGPVTDDDPADGPAEGQEGEPGVLGSPAGAPSVGASAGKAGHQTPEELSAEPEAVQAYHRRAKLAEDRLAEVLAAYRQVKTDNEGYRDRITRNLERRFDQRRERLLLKFINILDNMDRALAAAEQTYAGNPLIEGLILVRTELLQTLQEEGLERIPVIGLPYDPNYSEAVETRKVSEPEHHHLVVKELLRGYRLNGKVARVSRVVVGEYGGASAPAEAPAGALIGEDEVAAAETAPVEPPELDSDRSLEEIIKRTEQEADVRAGKPADAAEETAPIDEEMLRSLFAAPPPAKPEKKR